MRSINRLREARNRGSTPCKIERKTQDKRGIREKTYIKDSNQNQELEAEEDLGAINNSFPTFVSFKSGDVFNFCYLFHCFDYE
jgi:hypothetical protein